ncbi:peptidase M28-like protein [Mucilaginibacter gracilis]|uniref:Carboxypeptidase Q n=1 Tax=Mucilaginibacter gracilis TaxID=423350 RepID=A0A495IYF1_9SPHI|nr:M20/M25/M40 family metallo-hydrolase [Mucilaginibacter gracilis]RKR81084.1 peptidase M28-like protein [Mucilaginibacter gracilis]
MKKNLLLSVLLTAGVSINMFAQDAPDPAIVQKIRDEGLKNSKVMEIAFNLTDVSGPRLSGSPGLKRAQDWAVSQLKTWGMVNANREAWGKFGKGWEVQKNYAAITVPYYHAIIAIPKAWTPGTNGAIKGDVVYIKADTITDLEKYRGKLAGKVVILDAKPPVEINFTKPDASRYTDSALNVMAAATPQESGGRGGIGQRRGNFASLLALRTALSAFEVKEGVALVLSQARGTDGTVFTTNGASYRDTARAVAPELETSSEDYQRILRLVKAGIKVTMEADIKTEFFTNDLQGYNVVGEIPGTDAKLKDQLVMLGGHLDSWHGATGGTDNGAGAAVMMEAMRILKAIGFKPKRTIRIALWSGEEQGLFGSKNYVTNHFGDSQTMELKSDQAKISAYYNLDNGTGKIRGIYLQGNAPAGPIFQSWLNPFKDLGAGTVTIRNTGSTDHVPFDALGIPGFQFIQDSMDYGSRTHHSNQDTYDKLSEDDLKQAATIVASFVYNTAQRTDMIPRKELPKPSPPRTF